MYLICSVKYLSDHLQFLLGLATLVLEVSEGGFFFFLGRFSFISREDCTVPRQPDVSGQAQGRQRVGWHSLCKGEPG